jgi:hypothetical protein
MNYVIEASCDECGNLDLRVSEVEWWADRYGGDGYAMFRCPTCRHLWIREVGNPTISRLCVAGARRWAPEAIEPHPVGAPITESDLDAFQRGLENDWWPELFA